MQMVIQYDPRLLSGLANIIIHFTFACLNLWHMRCLIDTATYLTITGAMCGWSA